MKVEKNFEEIKKSYKYTLISEEKLREFYEIAKKSNDISIKFHSLVMDYLADNINGEIMQNYLKHLNINLKWSSSLIKTKLLTFFKLLDRINYFLNSHDINLLLEEEVFRVMLAKKFGTKEKIEYNEVVNFANFDSNFINICIKYLEINNITLIQNGQEHLNSNYNKNLSYKEEIDLIEKIKVGDREAYNKMIKANIKLVKKVARKYQNRGLDFDDLVQFGSIGLMTAIERFDSTKGCAFSSYATWWIKQKIKSDK